MYTLTFKEKRALLKASLPPLDRPTRWFLKLFLLCTGHLVTVEHHERLHHNQDPVLFVMNHNTSFETLLVPTLLIYLRQGRKLSFVIDWMFGRIPGIRWIFSKIDPIYVYNKPSTIAFLNKKYRDGKPRPPVYDNCIERLKLGKSVGIFPEGTRNPNPFQLLPGRKGLGHIVLSSGVSVVPIGIDFPRKQKTGKIPPFGRIVLRIGPALQFPFELQAFRSIDTAGQSTDGKKRQTAIAASVTHQIMRELANLCGKTYPYSLPSFQQNEENLPDRMEINR